MPRGYGKKGILLHFCKNANWFSHYGEQQGGFIKKLKIEFYDPAIPLYGCITPELKTRIQTDIWILAFMATLFNNSQKL